MPQKSRGSRGRQVKFDSSMQFSSFKLKFKVQSEMISDRENQFPDRFAKCLTNKLVLGIPTIVLKHKGLEQALVKHAVVANRPTRDKAT